MFRNSGFASGFVLGEGDVVDDVDGFSSGDCDGEAIVAVVVVVVQA